MKKTLLQVVLTLVIVLVGYAVYRSITAPIEFDKTLNERSKEIVQRLKDIRSLEQAYKLKHGEYTGSFDALIDFYNNDSLVYVIATGSEDDSLAVAQGLVSSYNYTVAVKDTLFHGRDIDVKKISDVPFSNNKKFNLAVAEIVTESEVTVKVFEASVPYFYFIPEDKYRQDIVNLNDKRETLGKYEGLKVGSLTRANNDAGNWE